MKMSQYENVTIKSISYTLNKDVLVKLFKKMLHIQHSTSRKQLFIAFLRKCKENL